MNPRQRRGVLLMAVAVVGALAVFLLVLRYVSDVASQVGPMTTVYRFTEAVPRLAVVGPDALEQVSIPVRWAPTAAVKSFDATRGLVATEDVPAGAMLQEGMVGPPPELRPGQREIAILIDAETGVAGKIEAGDLVDIYATFADSNGTSKDSQARVIVANAPVLAIGRLEKVGVSNPDTGRTTQNEVVPVTFALSVEDSLKVAYAESFASKVRLALIAPGSRSAANPQTDVLTKTQVFAKATPKPTPPKRGTP